MACKTTAVIRHPEKAGFPEDERVETYVFEVGVWYEALDQLCHEIQTRHPLVSRLGFDDIELVVMSMICGPEG